MPSPRGRSVVSSNVVQELIDEEGLDGQTGQPFALIGRWDSTRVYTEGQAVAFADGTVDNLDLYVASGPTPIGIRPDQSDVWVRYPNNNVGNVPHGNAVILRGTLHPADFGGADAIPGVGASSDFWVDAATPNVDEVWGNGQGGVGIWFSETGDGEHVFHGDDPPVQVAGIGQVEGDFYIRTDGPTTIIDVLRAQSTDDFDWVSVLGDTYLGVGSPIDGIPAVSPTGIPAPYGSIYLLGDNDPEGFLLLKQHQNPISGWFNSGQGATGATGPQGPAGDPGPPGPPGPGIGFTFADFIVAGTAYRVSTRGMRFMLDPSDPASVDNAGALATDYILDRSGNAIDFTEIGGLNKPVIDPAALNGLDVLTFDGTQGLSHSVTADTDFLHQGFSTVIAVAKCADHTQNIHPIMSSLWNGGGSQGYALDLWHTFFADAAMYIPVSGGRLNLALNTLAANTWGLLIATSNDGASQLRIAGADGIDDAHSLSVNSDAANHALVLGGGQGDGDFSGNNLIGSIAFLVAFDVALLASEVAQWEAYLNARYGL